MVDHLPDESKETQDRKIQHIDIILNKDTQYRGKTTMFEHIEVLPNEKPVDKSKVDITTTLLGKKLGAPIFVSGMTGGHPATLEINRNIALGISKLNIPMGVGSQRAMIEKKDLACSYDVKKFAKDIILIGNMGGTRLLKYGNEEIQEMLDSIDADMLALHTNPGQESVQPEGDIDFRGVYERVCDLAKSIRQPVILKEVGNGISLEVARKMRGKVFAVDVQGAGGTTWIGVETYRSKGSYGQAFWDWGIPTALSVIESKEGFKGPVWASGGIRSADDIIKAIAIGAEMCGMAEPVLVAQNRGGADGVYKFLSSMIDEASTRMGMLGFGSIDELKRAKVKIGEPLSSLIKQRGIKLDSRISC